MKLFLMMTVALLTGCAQLMHGQQQPVVARGQGTYFTTCGGTVEEWGSCFSKAKSTCANGYEILEKVEGSMGKREMTFMCK